MAVQLATLATMTDWVAAASVIALAASAHGLIRNNRLKAKVSIQQKEAEATVENLSEGFYRSSMDGTMLYANPALAAMNGYENAGDFVAEVNDKKCGL